MDGSRFDSLTRRLASGQSRRTAAALVGSLLAAPLLASPSVAKKKKKVTLCLDGQTIQASRKKKKKLLKNGATLGACPPPGGQTTPPPTGSTTTTTTTPAPTCRDGVRNGGESDADCGGPNCARCPNARRCDSRNDCASAFCVDNTCQACSTANTTPCGIDGTSQCGCGTDALTGQIVCVNPFKSSGSCTATGCPPDHACLIVGLVPTPTCFKLCGA